MQNPIRVLKTDSLKRRQSRKNDTVFVDYYFRHLSRSVSGIIGMLSVGPSIISKPCCRLRAIAKIGEILTSANVEFNDQKDKFVGNRNRKAK